MINEKNLLDIMQIKKDELKSNAPFNDEFCRGFAFAMEFVKQEPTIEAEPVVHGWWILKDDHGSGVCSNCHRQDKIDPLAGFCRYCGARMDGGDQNE